MYFIKLQNKWELNSALKTPESIFFTAIKSIGADVFEDFSYEKDLVVLDTQRQKPLEFSGHPLNVLKVGFNCGI